MLKCVIHLVLKKKESPRNLCVTFLVILVTASNTPKSGINK